MTKEAMKLALEKYMSAFGQALEAHGIPFQEQQIMADRQAREALAQSQSDVKQSVSVEQGGWHTHDLYTDADKDRPDVICDRNGQVTLGLCKRCGRGEAELETPCDKPKQEPVSIDWGSIGAVLFNVWYRELSADEGYSEIEKLINTNPQPALYVKDIDGNFHLHKEKGHTENCVAFGDDCSENHLSPSCFGIGKNNSTTKQEQSAEHVGEPVGEMQLSAIYEGMVVPVVPVELPAGTKLYTTPQQRKPLTDERIDEIYFKSDLDIERQYNQLYAFVRAIEAAHGIKGKHE